MATELENLVPEADVEIEGMRGPKGEKGDSYVLTEADKEEIARKVDTIIDSETDKTLTLNGKPADAKAAGNAIDDLKADLNQIDKFISEEIEWSESANGYLQPSGSWRNDAGWISTHTNKLRCSSGWTFEYIGGSYHNGWAPSVIFFNGDTPLSTDSADIGVKKIITIPENADGVLFQVANAKSGGIPTYSVKQTSPTTIDSVLGDGGEVGQFWVNTGGNGSWSYIDSYFKNKADQSQPPILVSEDTVGYINDSGILVNDSGWHCLYTDKISCQHGWKFRYQGGTYNNFAKSVLFFFDETAVSQTRYEIGSDVIVTVPDGVNQVIFQTATKTANVVSLSVEKVYPMSLEQVIAYCEDQNDKIDKKVDYSDNIVISDDTPGRMDAYRNITDTSAWHCLYTNVLDVKPGWKFKYIGGSYATTLSACVFFRNNGTPVSSESYDIGAEVEITIPDGVNQVWFQMSERSRAPLSLVVKMIYPVSLESVLSDFDNVSNRFYGLKDGTLLPKYKVIDGVEYGYVGRWYDYTYNGDNVKVASAAGAEVCFKVSGTTEITVNWTGENVTEHVYYCYYIDGNAKIRTNVTDNVISLPDTNEHIIRIVCDSIPHIGSVNCWTPGYGWVFGGVNAGNGTLKGIIPTNKTVMYFGDSLTEGVRAYGTETGEQVEADVDSATESYGFYASKYLGCSSVIVGYGSTGIMTNGYFRKCIDALNYLANDKETQDISPDLIVINHGHNDTRYNSETWINGFNAVIDRFTTKYPGVEVVALSPFNNTHADDMKTACEDKPHCHFISTASWGLSRYYADGPGHLTAEGADFCGKKLAQTILELNLL